MRLSEFTYISNILSISRILLGLPIYFLLHLQTPAGNYLAVGVMLLAALTDAYDGRLARRLKQKTDLGRILDPVADKICMAIIAIVLVRTRDLPVWFVVLVISRDIAIVLVGALVVIRAKIIVESNMLGKITVTALALTVIAYTLDISLVKSFFIWCTVVLIIVSSVSYATKMVRMAGKVN